MLTDSRSNFGEKTGKKLSSAPSASDTSQCRISYGANIVIEHISCDEGGEIASRKDHDQITYT